MRRIYCKTVSCRKWANINADGLCPDCASNTSDMAEAITPCICNICKEEVQDNETKALGCDLCKNWFHPNCVGDEAILNLLDAVSQLEGDASKFVGCLLWLCPRCTSEPKKINLNDGLCTPITESSKVSANKSKGTICKDYRLGNCSAGVNCKFSHPAKCLNYCRFGREGCSGGFQSCQLLHPVLCRDSLNYRKCFNESCTLAHLKGTNRNPQSRDPKEKNHSHNFTNRYGNRRRQHYSVYDRDNLGFQGHQRNHQTTAPVLSSNAKRINTFAYKEDDFPDALQGGCQQSSPNHGSWLNRNLPSETNFLEVLKSIQKSQINFQQELMSIRMLLPQFPASQGQLVPGQYPVPHQQHPFFNQPQYQSQTPMNQES